MLTEYYVCSTPTPRKTLQKYQIFSHDVFQLQRKIARLEVCAQFESMSGQIDLILHETIKTYAGVYIYLPFF